MEQKQKKKQKKIYIILAVLLVLAIALIGLAASGTITNWVAKYQSQKDYEALIAGKDDVTDAMTLRQLLLLDEELEITVTEDIEVKVGFTVNGTKTLRGDATISSNLGIFQPISIFEVSNDASLTMDGLVVDGNANAIGVKVSERGKLTYLSGEIIYAGTYGIVANGVVTIEDISISNCITGAIDAGFQSKVYFNGGEIVNNRHIAVYVEAQGYMEIHDGVVIDGTSGQGIRNRGELIINGGKFNDIGRYVVLNHNVLTIDYQGNDDGYIEMTNIGSGAVYNDKNGTAVVKDIKATNMGADAMKCVGGTVTVENCSFDTSGAHGYYISYGTVSIKDTKFTDCGSCGIYTISKANITLENVEFENVGTRGIMSKGSTITGNNVTVTNAGTYAISNEKSSDGTPAVAEYTNLIVSGSGSNNVFNGGDGTTVTIKDSVLNESANTNVYVGNGELTLDNVEILGASADNKAAISIASKGICNLTGNSKVHGNGIRAVNISGVFNMKGGEIYGYYPQKQSGGAVRLYKGGVFNMSGGSIYDNKTNYAGGAVFLNSNTTFNMTGGKIYGNTAGATSGAVQISINSTFNMKGGEIYNNKTLEYSGGAMMVQGVMNMSGGKIYQNTSASVGGAINLNSKTDSSSGKKIYGEFHMTGGEIYENVSAANGGALHVSSGTTTTLSGGSMHDNTARRGTGVNDNGNATVSGSFNLGNDTFSLGGTKIVVRIKGNTIGSHSTSKPFRLEPGNYSDVGVIAAECDSVAAATSINKIIAPQIGSYKLKQSENNIVVGGYTVADMSMKGADTVYVSNFQELKAAVEGTTSSRNVVISADIVMEGLVTVPDGTTVKLTDDGNKRTLSRKDNVVSAFFTASFGTGLVVDATKEGNLVFDGDGTNDAGKEFVQLMVVRGTTIVDGVVFKDNGAEGQTRDGAFILQKYGDITISNSSFTGAYGLTGGAVTITVGTANISNSTFADNTAKYNAGALRVSKEADVTVTDCTFKNNNATTVGGAINCDGGKLTVEGSTFENNTSVGTSGAINLTNGAVATVEGSTIIGNKSTADAAGAIKVNKSSLELTDSIISNNSTVDAGGALYVSGSSSVVTVTGGTFADNVSATTGGAIKAESGTTISLNGTTFEGNATTGTTGGAIDAYKATITAEGCIFRNNESVTHGGAIYLNTDSNATLTKCEFYSNSTTTTKGSGGALAGYNATANAYDCIFEENTSMTHGGAIYAAGASSIFNFEAQSTDANYNIFKANSADYEAAEGETKANIYGGAVYAYNGEITIKGYTFEGNHTYRNGGAIYIVSNANVTAEDSKFISNYTSTWSGGAIYNTGGFTATGCTFENNKAGSADGATAGTNSGGAIDANSTTETGTTAIDCTFSGNSAATTGKDIYIRRGTTVTINGGTFTDSEVGYQANNSSASMGQAIIEGGFSGNVTFIYSQANKAGIVISENGITGNDITILPKAYIKGHVLVAKSDATSDETLKAAAKLIKIADNGDNLEWVVESDGTIKPLGTLQVNIAQNATTGEKYTSIQAAVNAAQNGETIYILYDMELEEATTVSGGKNVIITNAPGKNVTLIRAFAGSLFTVESGSTLTLGSADTTSELTVDGGYSAEADGSIIAPALVNNAGTFNLLANATLQNAYTKASSNNANYNGGALYNTGTANLSGNFTGNKGFNGGAVYNADGTLNITGGVYSENIGAGQGGAIYVASGTDSATIANAEITKNDVSATHSRGVAIYLQGGASALTLENCNIHDNIVEYLNNTDIGSDVMIADDTTLNLKNNINVGVVHQRYGGTKPYGVINVVEDYTGNVVIVPNNNNFTVGETQLVNYASEMTADEKVETASQIIVRKVTDGVADDTTYCVDKNGIIQYKGARIGTTVYNTLQEAVNAVESGLTETTVIEILYNIALSETVAITDSKNITITNVAGSDITLTRAFAGSLFTVESGSTLTIGSTDTTNKFVVDGGKVSGTSLVNNAGTFNLAANATIQNANAGSNKGGALYNTGTAILSGTMTENTATHGGAVYNIGTVTVKAGTYSYNIATSGGGVIYSDSNASYVNVEAGTFEYNEAQGGTSGVIYGKATTTITGGTFQYNTAKTGGGVLNVAGSCTASISNATMTGNSLTASSYAGGAVYVSGKGTLNVENSTISGNSADYISNSNLGCDISLGANVTLNLKSNTNVGVVQQRYTNAVATINILEEYTSAIVFIPYNNTPVVDAQFVVFADTMSDEAKATAVANMLIRKYSSQTEYEDKAYYIDADGYLRQSAVKVGETYYKTLSEAVANIPTASEEATVVEVLANETLSEAITLLEGQKVVLQNSTGSEVKLTRDASSVESMFVVVANSSLTIDGTSALVLDGGYVTTDTSTSTVKSLIQNAGTLTLGANVTVQNANTKATSDPGTDKNEYKGGALYNTGTVTLSGNFTGNTGWNGGAIYGSGGTITITGGTYSDNTANNNGGVIAGSSSVIVETGTFQNNTATAGGGVFYQGANLEIQGGTFTENTSEEASGGVIYCNKTVTITGGTFYKNNASSYGGVVNVAGTADISNATMYENTVGAGQNRGAAIYVSSSKTLTLKNCNIFNNTYSNALCDVAFSNQSTYNKATIEGITANDGDDNATEYCYVNIGSTKYYIGTDGSTLTKVE